MIPRERALRQIRAEELEESAFSMAIRATVRDAPIVMGYVPGTDTARRKSPLQVCGCRRNPPCAPYDDVWTDLVSQFGHRLAHRSDLDELADTVRRIAICFPIPPDALLIIILSTKKLILSEYITQEPSRSLPNLIEAWMGLVTRVPHQLFLLLDSDRDDDVSIWLVILRYMSSSDCEYLDAVLSILRLVDSFRDHRVYRMLSHSYIRISIRSPCHRKKLIGWSIEEKRWNTILALCITDFSEVITLLPTEIPNEYTRELLAIIVPHLQCVPENFSSAIPVILTVSRLVNSEEHMIEPLMEYMDLVTPPDRRGILYDLIQPICPLFAKLVLNVREISLTVSVIGHGQFGRVLSDGEYAMKLIDVNSTRKPIRSVYDEIRCLWAVRRFEGMFPTLVDWGRVGIGGPVFIQTELFDMNLREFLISREVSTVGRFEIFSQIVKAVCVLHYECGIVHYDLKLDNMLAKLSDPVRVVISDFGEAQFENECMTGGGGTEILQPPEMFRGGENSGGKPADMWALGLLLYELLNREPIFRNEDEWIECMTSDEPNFPSRLGGAPIHQSMETLIEHLLTKDPSARADARHAIELVNTILHNLEPSEGRGEEWTVAN
jgi:hypothetical protein